MCGPNPPQISYVFFNFQKLFVTFLDRYIKYADLRVSGHAVKSPWASLVSRNAPKAATVLLARRSEMVTNVCPTHNVRVIETGTRMILEL